MAEELLPEVQKLVEKVKQEPQQVNGYNVVRHIGHGAFAEVFEAYNDRFHKIPVALKLPRTQEAVKDIKTRQIVLSALGRCQHSVNMAGEGSIGVIPYIAEEFAGESLAEVLEKNREAKTAPTLENILDLGRQLLTGAQYFHELKESDSTAAKNLGMEVLTHNDIKPSNIMVSNDARSGAQVYRFTDFGIRIDETPGAQAQTSCVNSASLMSIQNRDKVGRIMKDIYAAPEVREALLRQETPPATIPSDLFSIGAVLFAYATGNAPQWGEKDPRLLREDLPEGMTEFFGKLLHGQPEKRFQSAREALSALEESVNFAEDGYIFGITCARDGSYGIFKHPTRNGTPLKKFFETPFTTINIQHARDGITVPKLVYLPGLQKLLLTTWSGSPRLVGYDIALLNLDLQVTSRGNIGAVDNYAGINAPTVLRNKKTGQFCLKQTSKYKKYAYGEEKVFKGVQESVLTLPSFENMGSDIKTGLFSDWKKFESDGLEIKGTKKYMDREFYLELKNGTLSGGKLCGYNSLPSTETRIPIDGTVISAFYVPK